MLCIKRACQCTIFQTFECSNDSSPSSSCYFWNHKVSFIQILHHCSVSWKITPLYFLRSNFMYFRQKEPIEVKISDFWVAVWNFTKFFKSYLKPQFSFHPFSVSLDTICMIWIKEWCKTWRKTNLLLKKMVRIWWILI